MSKIAQSAVYDTPDMSFKRNEFRNRMIYLVQVLTKIKILLIC